MEANKHNYTVEGIGILNSKDVTSNEHSHILNSIEEILTNQKFIFERLQKLEDKTHNTVGDKALLSKLNMDVEDNRKDLYFVEDELKRHCKDAHISQGQVKKWIYELFFGEVKKIEEAKNGKD
jgi:hypothetical protein